MARWLRVSGDSRYAKCKGMIFGKDDIKALLGADFEIIQLMSGDVMAVRKDYKDYVILEINPTASTILNEPVYGDAIVAEPWELLL